MDEAQSVMVFIPGICCHAYLITKQRVFEDAALTNPHRNQSGAAYPKHSLNPLTLAWHVCEMCSRDSGLTRFVFSSLSTMYVYTMNISCGCV